MLIKNSLKINKKTVINVTLKSGTKTYAGNLEEATNVW